MMGIFDKLGQSGQQTQQVTPQMMRQEMARIQQDPGAYLKARGLNIPGGMTDPKQITQHLLRTGQIGSGRLQQIMRMLGR